MTSDTPWPRILAGLGDFVRTGEAGLDGKYVKAVGARLHFRPVQKPLSPLDYGGSSDAAIDFAAGRVDTNITWGEPPAQIAEKIGPRTRRRGHGARGIAGDGRGVHP